MEFNDYLVIGMFVTFICLLFTGFPIAWVLGGVAVIFTAVGYYSDLYFGTWTPTLRHFKLSENLYKFEAHANCRPQTCCCMSRI